MKTNTILFIHGMYMTPLCWEKWVKRLDAKGYHCQVPAWPGRSKSVDELRKAHPDAQLGKLTLSDIVNDLAAKLSKMEEKPILIGHSMGGLVVQLLLQKDLAAAGVTIDSAPPAGVFTTQWSFLKSNWPHINPFKDQNIPIEMSFERFQYTFVNGAPVEEQKAAYARYVVPESRRVPRESLTAKIDFKKPHAPLLFIAGGNDHIVPAALNKSNYERYKDPSSITDFKEFPGRVHFTLAQKGWEEVADYIFDWLKGKAL